MNCNAKGDSHQLESSATLALKILSCESLVCENNNLVKKVWFKNEPTSYEYTYNPTHTVKDVTDNQGRKFSYSYDVGNRLTKATDQTNSGYGNYPVRLDYDGVSNLPELRAGSDSTITYSYNEVDNLIGIDLTGGSADEVVFDYDKASRRTAIGTPGSTSTIKYDPASRITKWTNVTASETQTVDYTHDANGNTLSADQTEYTYDDLNRLKTWYDLDTDTTTTYSYDSVGNLTTVKENGSTVKSFTYNGADQISSSGYSYDDNGNLTADSDHNYSWDGDNRLTSVVDKSTSQTIASYTHDYMGRRISATDSSGNTTFFHYDGWNVVAESNQAGQITARYYYNTNEQITAMKRGGSMYYYQKNAHGDVVSLTDASGNIVNEYRYDPWGKVLGSTETVENPYLYAGYRYDEDTELYYLRARYYSPGSFRFLSKDSVKGDIRAPQTLNPYTYVKNNPVNLVDPTGEDWRTIGIASVGAVAAVAGVAALVAGAPVLGLGVGAWGAISLASSALGASTTMYSWSLGETPEIVAGPSLLMSVASGIPVFGVPFAVGSAGWEMANHGLEWNPAGPGINYSGTSYVGRTGGHREGGSKRGGSPKYTHKRDRFKS